MLIRGMITGLFCAIICYFSAAIAKTSSVERLAATAFCLIAGFAIGVALS